MCFDINRRMKRPRQKYVYKVVDKYERCYRSATKMSSYRIGVLKKAQGTVWEIEGDAHHGIHVFLDKDDALAERRTPWLNRGVLKCKVRPSDWLHSGRGGLYGIGTARVATYKAVLPVEELA